MDYMHVKIKDKRGLTASWIHLSLQPIEDETVTMITQRNYLIRCINN